MQRLLSDADCLVCCPLRRWDNTYSFLHKSIQECFAAFHMACQISHWRRRLDLAAAEAAEPPQQLQQRLFIGDKLLTCDVAVVKFFAQFVDQRVWPYRRLGASSSDATALQPLGRGLFDLVYASRRLPQQSGEVAPAVLAEGGASVVRAAANAISVLVCAGVSLAGV